MNVLLLGPRVFPLWEKENTDTDEGMGKRMLWHELELEVSLSTYFVCVFIY